MLNDKVKPDQHEETPEGTHADSNPTMIFHQIGDSEPNSKTANEEHNDTGNQDKPMLPVRLWRQFRRKPRPPRANWAEKSTVFITFILAFIGIVQARIYWLQKGIMQSSSAQTDKLIEAAQIQAQASKDFAATAKTLAQQMGVNLEQQQQIARAAHGLPFIGGLQYVELFRQEDRRRVWGIASVMNTGQTYADGVRVAIVLDILSAPPPKPRKFADSDFRETIPSRLEPERVRPELGELPAGMLELRRKLSARQYSEYKTDESVAVYVWGQIKYKDFVGGELTNDFCTSYVAKDVLGPPNGPHGGYIDQHKSSKKCD